MFPVHIAFRAHAGTLTPSMSRFSMVEGQKRRGHARNTAGIKFSSDVLETIAAGVNRLTTEIPLGDCLGHKIAVDPRAQHKGGHRDSLCMGSRGSDRSCRPHFK